MNPDDIKRSIVPLEPGDLFPTDRPNIFRSNWKNIPNGAKMCVLYTVVDGRTVATTALCLPTQDEQKALKEALDRFSNI